MGRRSVCSNAQRNAENDCVSDSVFRIVRNPSLPVRGRSRITTPVLTNKSSTFFLGFRGISRLGSAFMFLQLFKLAHICIQVASLHRWHKQGINREFWIGKRFQVTLRIVKPINSKLTVGSTHCLRVISYLVNVCNTFDLVMSCQVTNWRCLLLQSPRAFPTKNDCKSVPTAVWSITENVTATVA